MSLTKRLIASVLAVTTMCLLPIGAIALEKMYNELALWDLDQMSAAVKKKIAASRKSTSDKVSPLKDGLRLVFSRPDDDGMVEKILGNLRSELEENEAWDSSMRDVADESINALKNPGEKKPAEQVTNIVVLQNIVGELKPYAHGEGFEKPLLEKIRDARISITKAAKNERLVRTGKETKSPSDLAEEILNAGPKPKRK